MVDLETTPKTLIKPKLKPVIKNKDSLNQEITVNQEIPVNVSKLNRQLTQLIENNVKLAVNNLLEQISNDYHLDFRELSDRYTNKLISEIRKSSEKLSKSSLISEKIKSPLKENLMDSCSLVSDIAINGVSSETGFPVSETADKPSETKNSITETNSNSSPALNHIDIDITKCLGRTGNDKQCSRKRQAGQEFCGGHLHNQPNGRVDQAKVNMNIMPIETSIIRKKPKTKKESKKSNQDLGDPMLTSGEDSMETPSFVSENPKTREDPIEMEMEMETIGGIDYIVDCAQNVYEIPPNIDDNDGIVENNQLKIVGKKLSEGKIVWYSDSDQLFIRSMA